MRNKIFLKLAIIAFSVPQFVFAGSDDRDKNPETSVEMGKIHPPSPGLGELLPTDPRTVVETPAAAQQLFERVPSEIIRLILDGLSKPDLKNLRLVDQKLRDVVTSFLTDIKIPRNIPSAEQVKTFFQDLATVKFWEGRKPSEAFINLFRNAPIEGLELGRKEISVGNLKTLLPAFPSALERLYLHDNNIGAEGAKAVAEKLPSTLNVLDLSKNKIGTEGAKALVGKLPAELLYLSLDGNEIGDEGLRAWLGAIPKTALQNVTISVPETSPLREQFKNLRNRKGRHTITFK
ncbi:MAG: hypothetical protein ACRCYP_06795 [Alphaproteobacteria bacterium]